MNPVLNAGRIRNSDWENDEDMRRDLKKYVRQNLRRKEILDFMIADYPMYAWSTRSLSRRLQHFGIKYTDYEIELEDVKNAVKKELDGPGALLGYRAMQQKVREVHGLNASRDLVYAVMGEADPEGLKSRGGIGKTKRPQRTKAFVSGVSFNVLFKQYIWHHLYCFLLSKIHPCISQQQLCLPPPRPGACKEHGLLDYSIKEVG